MLRCDRAAGAWGSILVGVSRMDRSWCWFLDRSGFRKAGIHVFVVLTGGCYRRLRRRRASLGCIFGGTAGSVQRRGH